MKAKGWKTVALTLLIAAIVTISGCNSYSGPGGTGSSVPTPSEAEEVQLPTQVEDSIKGDVSQNASISAYTSEKAPDTLDSWYKEQLPSEGWEKVNDQQGLTLWQKGEDTMGLAVMSTDTLGQVMNISNSANSLALLIEADMQSWESLLTHVSGQAVIEGDTLKVTVTSIYPSQIPADQYSYTIRGLRNTSDGNSPTVVRESTPGEATLEEGKTIEIPTGDAQPGDGLFINYSGSVYPLSITTPNGTSAAPGAGSGHP